MNPCRRTVTIASTVCALALLCAGSASAQEIFKQVDENGSTTFSDQPPRKTVVLPRRGGKVDVSEAARRLERARLERKQGLEPRPGEFTQVSGKRTVNYRYWTRQEKLRVAVEQAQRRSQATLGSASRGQVKVSQI
jgi:hypothetical protein